MHTSVMCCYHIHKLEMKETKKTTTQLTEVRNRVAWKWLLFFFSSTFPFRSTHSIDSWATERNKQLNDIYDISTINHYRRKGLRAFLNFLIHANLMTFSNFDVDNFGLHSIKEWRKKMHFKWIALGFPFKIILIIISKYKS